MLRAWGGLIDMAPDGAGLVGEAEELAGFYLDCGWGGEGYMVAPATGRLGAEYLNTGVLDARLAPFHYTPAVYQEVLRQLREVHGLEGFAPKPE